MIYGQEESHWIIEQLIEDDSMLNDWERNFIDSLYNQVSNDRKLSIKQRETLSKIWEKCN